MNVVSDEHKATLRQWHEELQEKRGLRASLRRSATLNDVCLSEGFHSLMVQTHSLWNTREGVAFYRAGAGGGAGGAGQND